jgi:hypothetical protein
MRPLQATVSSATDGDPNLQFGKHVGGQKLRCRKAFSEFLAPLH